MSWATCYSGSNPIHKNLPPLMSDARLFTKLDPNCEANDKLKRFLKIANELNLDCIIETHDESEIKRALKLNYPIIGINNRNLKNLKTDINNSVKLFTNISKDYTIIAESGIKSSSDINMYNELGIFNFLIGESILRADNYQTFIKKLLNNE